MCRGMRAMWPVSELSGWPHARTDDEVGEEAPGSPAEVESEESGVSREHSLQMEPE
jgi:hypothetical protein